MKYLKRISFFLGCLYSVNGWSDVADIKSTETGAALSVTGTVTATGVTTPAVPLPKIRLEEMVFDFGTVTDKETLKHNFIIENIGDHFLNITNTQASCGCTSTMVTNKNITPKGSGIMAVSLNPQGKQGHVEKSITITSNDPVTPQLVVQIKATIMTTLSMKQMRAAGVSMFATKEGCAACHVVKGEGKFGEALYKADCAMCHGQNGEGHVGPNLNQPSLWTRYSVESMEKLITQGTKNPEMPGFGKKHGGPLGREQIQSLAQYLKKLTSITKVYTPTPNTLIPSAPSIPEVKH